ncbi:C40 family peptidase [uncultured Cedecea sp.]|uniref:C40 family peptidase n=1 Tax=uncultured Cedecea sp. TaxID=988762 RepID=UPI00260C0084|nr:C40 family peptidase [uncultured Cedecea sp.]
MTPSTRFFLLLGTSLINFPSTASQLSDITILTPTETRHIKFSDNSEQSHARTSSHKAQHYSLSELEKKGLRVKVSENQQIRHLSEAPSSTKALVRTGLRQQARLHAQRAESSFSQQVQRSGQDVEVLLRRLTLRPLYQDRYLRARQIALNTLMEQLGKPYLWGGASPLSGFDCSGLIYFAYKDHIKRPFPRTARGMFHLSDAKIIRSSELEPGDLVFFRIRQDYVDHVGVYIGNNQFIQSPRTGLDIRISKLSDNYWQNHYVGARRVMTPENIL